MSASASQQQQQQQDQWKVDQADAQPVAAAAAATTTDYTVEHYSPAATTQDKTVYKSNQDLEIRIEAFEKDGDETWFPYRRHFYGQGHKNFVGAHPTSGPVCVSLRKERAIPRKAGFVYRGILRTSTKFQYVVKRTAQLVMVNKTSGKHFIGHHIHTRDVLNLLFPVLAEAKFKEIGDTALTHQLAALEERLVEPNYKCGVLFARAGQVTEDDMFSNDSASPEFTHFLSCLGDTINLKDYTGFNGGLDVRDNTTGTKSVVGKYRDLNIMFHVSTMLPYSPANKQQIARKTHLLNDLGLVVFKEPGVPFDPACLAAKTQHFVIVVEPVDAFSETLYRVSCVHRTDMPSFGPYPSQKVFFTANKDFRNFLQAKLINGEHAAYMSERLSALRQRTRRTFLDDLLNRYVSDLTSLNNWQGNEILTTADQLNADGSLKKPTVWRRLSLAFSALLEGRDRPSQPTSQPLSLTHTPLPKDPTKQQQPQPQQTSVLASSQNELSRSANALAGTAPAEKPATAAAVPVASAPTNLTSLARPDTTLAKELSALKTENAELKARLDQMATNEVNRMLYEQNELRLKVELMEMRVKLTKALANLERVTGEQQQLPLGVNKASKGPEVVESAK